MTEGPGQGALAIDERPSEKSERSARRADALTGRWGAWPWLLALVVVASMLPIGLGAVSAAPAGAPSIGGAFG